MSVRGRRLFPCWRFALLLAWLDVCDGQTLLSEAVPFSIRAGEPFNVRITGGDGFDTKQDKIILIPWGASCGSSVLPPPGSASTIAQYAEVMCDGGGSAATVLVCTGLVVYAQGTWSACVCDHDGDPEAGLVDPNASLTTTQGPASFGCMTRARYYRQSTGVVTVDGPSFAGVLERRAGARQDLVLAGTRLSVADRVRIIASTTSCSDASGWTGMHQAVSADWPAEVPSGQPRFQNEASETWTDVAVTTPGSYRVCWCGAGRGGCDDEADFPVEAAALVVYGPDPAPQAQRCITGVRCTLSVAGTGMRSLDRIRVIASTRSCGTAPMSSSVLQDDLGEPSSSEADGRLARWGGVVIQSSGSFSLCWCGRNENGLTSSDLCASSLDFNIYVGEITVGGPDQGRYDRPPLGVPFTYSVTGWGLSGSDRITIVDETVQCGREGAEVMSAGVWRNSLPEGPPASTEGDAPQNNATKISWDSIILTRMQDYRVCWCARYTGNCKEASHFALDLGTMRPRGPEDTVSIAAVPNRPFALTLNAAVGSMFSFSLADRIRIVSQSAIGGLCGEFGTSQNSRDVADLACWPVCQDTAHSGPPTLPGSNASATWNPVLLTASGVFAVCFCSHGLGGCNSDEDFLVKAAQIVASGVTTGHTWHCANSLACVLDVPASGGASVGDAMQLITDAPGAVCGVESQATVSSFSRGTRIFGHSRTDENGQAVIAFDFGVPSEPGAYRACYCQGQETCRDNLDFFQDSGSLTVSGLADQNRYYVCYLGSRCDLSVQGTGLQSMDGVMLVGPGDFCGAAVGLQPGFTGEGFSASEGFLIFIPTWGGTADDGLERWLFALGTPSVTGRYRLCYCHASRASGGLCSSHRDFDQLAGEVFVRGSEVPVQKLCTQGEACELVLRAQQLDDQDRLLLYHQNYTCGDPSPEAYVHWMTAASPSHIGSDVIIPDLLAATYRLEAVREPGRYHICYCAYIRGGDSCLLPNDGDPIANAARFQHNAGSLRVTGAITSMQEVLSPPLPSTPYAASAAAEVFMPGVYLSCAVTQFPAPAGFLPQMSDVQNCSLPRDSPLLSSRQRLFPRCLGFWTLPDAVAQTGQIQVHVPLTLTAAEAAAVNELHMWCYASELCANDRCVMPATHTGTLLSFTQGLARTDTQWHATVGTSFSLGVQLANDFVVGTQWPRIKIVRLGAGCDRATLLPSASGITCSDSPIGKCEPEPISSSFSGTLGTSRELLWQNLEVSTIGNYDVCYCDRHFGQACLLWLHIGTLGVSGPLEVGSMELSGNPDSRFEVVVLGSGLQRGDRLRMIPDSGPCTLPTNDFIFNPPPDFTTTLPPPPEATTTTSADTENNSTDTTDRRLSSSWGPYPPVVANETFQRWEGQLTEMGSYSVCWCGAASRSCVSPADFTVRLGRLRITEKVDCELSDWWVAAECDRPCGGGQVHLKRDVRRQAAGGGEPCPGADALTMTQQCNMEPCPLARVDRARTEPEFLRAGSPFVVHIEGHWMDSAEDRILLVAAASSCGDTEAHFGGASCAQPGSSESHLICGDGTRSIRVQSAGDYRVCFCDASAAIVRSHDGTRNVSSGSFDAIGLGASGCANAMNYLLMPAAANTLAVAAPEALPPAAAAAEASGGLAPEVVVLLVGLLALLCVCCAASCYLLRLRLRQKRQKMLVGQAPGDDYTDIRQDDPLKALTAQASMPQGPDPHMLQFYETYYQSMGLPPGTATTLLAGAPPMQALPAPPPVQPPELFQPQLLALQNAPVSLPQPLPVTPLQQMPPPMLSASPRTPPPLTPPGPPPGGRAKSPRTLSVSPRSLRKSFGDLVKDADKRQSAPAFTDMDLSPMPTPTCTPRGGATPRDGQVSATAPLAIEDSTSGTPAPQAETLQQDNGDSSGSEHDDRVSLALSESSAGLSMASPMPSRPNSGDPEAAPPPPESASSDKVPRLTQSELESHDRGMEAQSAALLLTPVKEESEAEDSISPNPRDEKPMEAVEEQLPVREETDLRPPTAPQEAEGPSEEPEERMTEEAEEEPAPAPAPAPVPAEEPPARAPTPPPPAATLAEPPLPHLPPREPQPQAEPVEGTQGSTAPEPSRLPGERRGSVPDAAGEDGSNRTPRQLSAFLNGRLQRLLGSSTNQSEAASPVTPPAAEGPLAARRSLPGSSTGPGLAEAARGEEAPLPPEAPASQQEPGDEVQVQAAPPPPPTSAWASRPTTPVGPRAPPATGSTAPQGPQAAPAPPPPPAPEPSEVEVADADADADADAHDGEARPVTPAQLPGKQPPVEQPPGEVFAMGGAAPPPPGTAGPPLVVDTDLDDTLHSTDSNGWKAPSLSSLHQSMQNHPPSPSAVPRHADEAPGPPPPPPGRPPRGPGPGPSLTVDTEEELEDTLHSVGSLVSAGSGSPSGTRRKATLAGLAASSSHMQKGVNVGTPSHSKPKRAVVSKRVPQAFDRPELPPPPPPLASPAASGHRSQSPSVRDRAS